MGSALAVNAIFTIEMIVHGIAYGFIGMFKKRKQFYYELCLQIVFLISLNWAFQPNFKEQAFACSLNTNVILFRTLRLLYLMMEL